MFEKLKITITSRGRYKQYPTTLKYIHETFYPYIDFYCYESELKQYQQIINKYTNKLKVKPYPKSLANLTEVRKWLIHTSDKPYLIFIDDDLDLYTRLKPTKTNEITVSGYYIFSDKWFDEQTIYENQLQMFKWFETTLQQPDIGACGLALRTTGYHLTQKLGEKQPEQCVKYNTRVTQFFGIALNKWQLTNSDFEGIILKQDFYIALQFLTHCYKTVMNYYWVFSDTTKADDKTGCNIYRTKELYNQQVEYFHKLYPNFTSIETKQAKLWQTKFNDTVYELKVNWQKAYDECNKKQRSIKTLF